MRRTIKSSSSRKLARHFEAMQTRLASTPALRPTKGWLTSRFGMRKDPMTSRNTMHRGIDFAASIGTPIVSPADGAVIKVEEQTGYGLVVMVDHGFGMMTKYAHLADAAVLETQCVAGDRIDGVGYLVGRQVPPTLRGVVRWRRCRPRVLHPRLKLNESCFRSVLLEQVWGDGW